MSSNETKLKIIETAKNLLLSDNTQGLSIRKICASSKISYGSFYHHMKSKENLMLLIRKNVVEEGMAEFLKKTENKAPLEKIIILSNFYINYIVSYGYKFCGYFIALAVENPVFASPPGALLFLPDLIKEAIESKDFNSKYEVDYINRALLSVLRGSVFEWCSNKGISDLKSDVSITFGLLIKSLKED